MRLGLDGSTTLELARLGAERGALSTTRRPAVRTIRFSLELTLTDEGDDIAVRALAVHTSHSTRTQTHSMGPPSIL